LGNIWVEVKNKKMKPYISALATDREFGGQVITESRRGTKNAHYDRVKKKLWKDGR